ncbi:serine/threonine-protein kinase [Micromonospora pisi]|uniref:non-specific serine/threonine protein kinase n=1 Tax=Micromonospora pisi TaxID=589240 RepID=A0A495JTW7_9ACTN|nr:serine/threonine-protein kinase [Micromonospora pisi]RKR91559.1 serine/threonine-protein kinase [Micromonospora pisi]
MGGAGVHGTELLGGRYRLVERLGAGGMSVVWRGYDEVLGRQVAVKVLASRLADDRAFRRQIRVEAQAVARLVHPHITGVYDYGESVTDGLTVPYVVMELVDGESLAARLAREHRLPWRPAVAAIAEAAAALAAAHARGIVHRDVTPGNVMLTDAGVKVVDFGISALSGENDTGPDGRLLGTPAYCAPERLDGGQVSPAADVYALGLLLYRTLTGHLPWPESSATGVLRAHLYQEPAPLPPVDGLPDEVVDLCARCLAKTPGERPDSAEVARTLAEAAGTSAVLPVSPAPAGAGSPIALANAGTTILPWAAGTDALPLRRPVTGHRPPWRSRPASTARRPGQRATGRRIGPAALGLGLLAVSGLAWAANSLTPGPRADVPLRAEAATQPAPCQIGYALRTDTGRAFEAEVTVRNTGDQPVRDWVLTFDFPAEQTVTGAGAAQWQQRDRGVVLHPADAGELTPGSAATVRLTGTYTGTNPLPVQFRLGDAACAAQVSGIAGTSPPAAGAATSGVTSKQPVGRPGEGAPPKAPPAKGKQPEAPPAKGAPRAGPDRTVDSPPRKPGPKGDGDRDEGDEDEEDEEDEEE